MLKKCNKALIDKVRPLVERGAPWTVIAKACDTARTTLFNYKNPDSEHYDANFADMVREALEARDTGLIRAGQFEQAKKHILKKVTKVPTVIKTPTLPPSSFTKDQQLRYADEELDLILDPKFTIKEMRYEMARYIPELIEWGEPYYVVEDVIVKIEETECEPNQAAVKNVETNTGDPAKRWSFKDDIAVSGAVTIENVIFGKPEKTKTDG